MRPAPAEPAATVCLLRPGAGGFEAYLTVRHPRLLFLGGHHVFPGGKVEESDYSAAMLARCVNLSPAEAAAPLGLADQPERALGFRVAAVRELFEETGVLLAEGPPLSPAGRERRRAELQADRKTFLAMIEEDELFLPLDRLQWFAHWVTPATSPRRFDTHFFAALMPPGQEADPDRAEISAAEWEPPARTIEKWKRGEIKIIPPTLASLDFLSRFADWESLCAHLAPGRLEKIGSAAAGVETVALPRREA